MQESVIDRLLHQFSDACSHGDSPVCFYTAKDFRLFVLCIESVCEMLSDYDEICFPAPKHVHPSDRPRKNCTSFSASPSISSISDIANRSPVIKTSDNFKALQPQLQETARQSRSEQDLVSIVHGQDIHSHPRIVSDGDMWGSRTDSPRPEERSGAVSCTGPSVLVSGYTVDIARVKVAPARSSLL